MDSTPAGRLVARRAPSRRRLVARPTTERADSEEKMSDRDITIELRAKNVTDQAFQKVQATLGKLAADVDRVSDRGSAFGRIFTKAGDDVGMSFAKMAGGFAVGGMVDRAAGALFNMAAGAIAAAGDTIDLAAKTGFSTDAIQRMAYVAEQAGSNVDTFTNAAFKLGITLDGGGKSVVGAVEKLGLSYDSLRAMSPEKQFEAVMEAAGKLTVAQGRNSALVELFGKAAKDVLPAVEAGYRKVGDAARVASAEQLRAIDDASDAWDGFKRNLTVGTITAIGGAVRGVQSLTSMSITELAKYTAIFVSQGAAAAAGYALSLHAMQAGVDESKGSVDAAIETHRNYSEELRNARSHMASLTAEGKRQFAAAKELGATTEDLTRDFGFTATQLRLPDADERTHVKNLRDQTKETKEAAKAQQEFLDRVRAQAAAAQLSTRMAQATGGLTEAVMAHRQELLMYLPELDLWQDANAKTTATLQALVAAGQHLKAKSPREVFEGIEKAADAATIKAMSFGRGLSQSIFGALQGGGDIGKSVGAFIGDSIGKTLGEKLAKSLAGALGEKFAGALGGMLGPLGAIGGQMLGSLVDKIFGHKGRDAVKEFADSFGGFSGLQEKLRKTFDPETANKYWTALTQGVGRNNPQQAKQVIDAVTAAIERQNAALTKTPQTFANASAAAEALGLDITKIGDGINDLRVHDSAEEIAAQWQVLKDAGADMDQVASGAAGKFQVLVDEALKWGHQLPESMREPLQRMVDMGKLTDASGDKLEDLSEIKWAEPLEKSVDRVIDKIDQLIDRIAGGLSGAIRGIPGVDVGVSGGGGDPEASHAAGAFIRQDHVANVHAGEIIGPVDFMSRALEGALSRVKSVGAAGTVIVQFGTREIARMLMPEIAGEVQRLRLV
jgi:hypothetical protein